MLAYSKLESYILRYIYIYLNLVILVISNGWGKLTGFLLFHIISFLYGLKLFTQACNLR